MAALGMEVVPVDALAPPEEIIDILTQTVAIQVPAEPVWQKGESHSWMNNNVTHTTVAAKCYSESMYNSDAFYVIVTSLMTGTVCVIGLVGNLFAVYILYRDQRKNLITVLLAGLCVVDCFLLLYFVIAAVVKSTCLYLCNCDCLGSVVTLLPYLWPWSIFVQMVMTWTIVMASFSRYVAVCHPFRFRDFNTVKIGKRMVSTVTILCFLFQLPRIIMTYITQGLAPTNPDNARREVIEGQCFISNTPTSSVLNVTEDWLAENLSSYRIDNGPSPQLDRNVWYRDVYLVGLTWVFMYIVPITSLLYMNMRLLIETQRAKKIRMKMSCQKSDIQDHSMTINIIAIISFFLVCQTPDFISVVISYYPSLGVSIATKRYVIAISIFLQAINSAIDFLIYFTFYARFRSDALRLLCSIVPKRTWTAGHPSTPTKTESSLLTPMSDMQVLCLQSKHGDVRPREFTAV